MTSSRPFDPSAWLSPMAGSRPIYYDSNSVAECSRQIYTFGTGDDYVQFPDLAATATDRISFSFIPPPTALTSWRVLLYSDDATPPLRTFNNIYRLSGCTATLDGVPIANSVTQVPDDGAEHTIVVTMTSSRNITGIAGSIPAFGSSLNYAMYDLSVNSTSLSNRFYALNEGEGAVTAIDSISGLDGTYVNTDPAYWNCIDDTHTSEFTKEYV